jgi:oligopeptide transport system permease protein
MRNTILPIVTLALPQVAVVARMTRAAMIEVLRSNHIRTLRANGPAARSVIVSHALRGAALPVVSYLGPAAAALLTGLRRGRDDLRHPGIGRYFVEGALNRDYTLVMGTVVVIAIFVLFFNLLVDLAYALARPARALRLSEGGMATIDTDLPPCWRPWTGAARSGRTPGAGCCATAPRWRAPSCWR